LLFNTISSTTEQPQSEATAAYIHQARDEISETLHYLSTCVLPSSPCASKCILTTRVGDSICDSHYFTKSPLIAIGSYRTLADVHLGVMLAQLEIIKFDLTPFPKLRVWYDAIKASPSFEFAHHAFFAAFPQLRGPKPSASGEPAATDTNAAATSAMPTLYWHPISPPSRSVYLFCKLSGSYLARFPHSFAHSLTHSLTRS